MAIAYQSNVASAGAADDGSSTTVVTTGTLAVSAGDLLVAMVNWASAAATLDTVASPSNSFTRFPSSKEDAGNDNVECFYKENASAEAAAVFTATFSASSTFRRIVVLRITGAATSGAADKTAINAVTGATSISAALAALAQANEIIVSIMGSSGGSNVWVPTDGGTHIVNSLGGDTDVWYEIVAGVGPHTSSFGGSGSQDAWMTTVSFKEGGGLPAQDVTNVGGIARPTMQVVCREPIWLP